MCISSGFFRWFNMVVGVARSQSVDIIIRKLRRKKPYLELEMYTRFKHLMLWSCSHPLSSLSPWLWWAAVVVVESVVVADTDADVVCC